MERIRYTLPSLAVLTLATHLPPFAADGVLHRIQAPSSIRTKARLFGENCQSHGGCDTPWSYLAHPTSPPLTTVIGGIR